VLVWPQPDEAAHKEVDILPDVGQDEVLDAGGLSRKATNLEGQVHVIRNPSSRLSDKEATERSLAGALLVPYEEILLEGTFKRSLAVRGTMPRPSQPVPRATYFYISLRETCQAVRDGDLPFHPPVARGPGSSCLLRAISSEPGLVWVLAEDLVPTQDFSHRSWMNTAELEDVYKANCAKVTNATLDFSEFQWKVSDKQNEIWKGRSQTALMLCRAARANLEKNDVKTAAELAVQAWGQHIMNGTVCCPLPHAPFCLDTRASATSFIVYVLFGWMVVMFLGSLFASIFLRPPKEEDKAHRCPSSVLLPACLQPFSLRAACAHKG
ncbi:unnamed protein product, partial [Symbiodinium necroappetens]